MMRWLKELLEWESKVILGEESWQFHSGCNKDALMMRLKSDLDLYSPLPWWSPKLAWPSGSKSYIGQLQKHRVKIESRGNWWDFMLWWRGFANYYCFDGAISQRPGNCVLIGTYRIVDFIRPLLLITMNGFVLAAYGVLIMILGEVVIGGAQTPFNSNLVALAAVVLFLPVPLLTYVMVYGMFRWAKYCGKERREEFRAFLSQLVGEGKVVSER